MKHIPYPNKYLAADAIEEKVKDFLYCDRRRASLIRQLDTDWPQIPAVRDALVDYIGIAVLKHETPIVLVALERAANAYEKKVGLKPDYLRFQTFLDSALDVVIEYLNGLRVTAADGSLWRPDCGMAFVGWACNRQGLELTQAEGDELEAGRIRRSILSHLQPFLPNTYIWSEQ